MLKIGRTDIILLTLGIGFFLFWNLGNIENDWMKSIGNLCLQVVIGVLTVYWLFNAYRNISTRRRIFWLLLTIGAGFYLSANTIWLLNVIISKKVDFPDITFLLWLIAYSFFLASLTFMIKMYTGNKSTSHFYFNVSIFIVTAFSIVAHYLITPILAIPDESFLVKIITIAFPVISISILFANMSLFYIAQARNEKSITIYIFMAFFLQSLADLYYTYESFTGGYHPGTFSDFLWVVSSLSLGFGGYHATRKEKGWEFHIGNPFEHGNSFFPYVNVMFLIIMVSLSYQWQFNALSMGLVVVFLLLLGRQSFILKRNKKLLEEFKHLAYHDPLTGLSNRAVFLEDLNRNLRKADEKDSRVGLLLLDLDRFKDINDTLGHDIGDQLLIKVSRRLTYLLEFETSVYRIGGDEFLILQPNATEESCRYIAEKILRDFKRAFNIGEYEISISPSIGISLYPNKGRNGKELLKYADAAMYLAKSSGKNHYRFYTSELKNKLNRKVMLENALRKAIENKQLKLYYQPKVDLRARQYIGMEALLRWEHPDLGFISPMEFIPIAEETGEIVQIGKWVMKEACLQNQQWQNEGYPPLPVSINVSVRQFWHNDFVKAVDEVLKETGLNPEYLELEITESIMQNVKETTGLLTRLRKRGVKISIDDFGTGYSSLHILNKLPIDTIKIDKSFIDNIEDKQQQSMVKTIIELGNNANFHVIAEGIEHENQVKTLLKYKCFQGQGYLFSKPLVTGDFEEQILTQMMKEELAN